LHLDLTVDEFDFPVGSSYWYEWANGIMTWSNNQFLKLPAWTDLNYDDAFYVFNDEDRGEGCRKELYLGLGTAPVELDMEAVDEGLNQVASGSCHSMFTSYSVLSAPFLPFVVPTFLCESQFSHPDFDLSPSRLEHLEISLGFDPSDPTETARQVDAFFAMISPRIERLSLRLRLTCPQLSPLDEMTLTNHFFAGLRSCLRLTHLELGGFGLADNFLTHLAALPLKTLILHPMYPVYSRMEVMEQLLGFESTTLARNLRFLELEDLDENKHEENGDEVKLEEMCADRGIKVSHRYDFPWSKTVDKEAQILASLMADAGVEWDW